ncbi:hypothetical protein [Nostoc sp.]|uniref:hypothetical protein n=1 Tax=Nostoc sp. TaxID=1180 RepID=UPI002FFAA3CB
MEQFIKEAIGLGSPQIQPESEAQSELEPQPTVTIYDFGRLLTENEPDKKQK